MEPTAQDMDRLYQSGQAAKENFDQGLTAFLWIFGLVVVGILVYALYSLTQAQEAPPTSERPASSFNIARVLGVLIFFFGFWKIMDANRAGSDGTPNAILGLVFMSLGASLVYRGAGLMEAVNRPFDPPKTDGPPLLHRLAELHHAGLLSDEEFAAKSKALLSGTHLEDPPSDAPPEVSGWNCRCGHTNQDDVNVCSKCKRSVAAII